MKKKILITWPLPDAVMARARASYDVIAHGDNPKITIEELLETAKSVDAILLTRTRLTRRASDGPGHIGTVRQQLLAQGRLAAARGRGENNQQRTWIRRAHIL